MPSSQGGTIRARINTMLEPPRRWRLADWDNKPLKAPGEFGGNPDWNLSFPFIETFVPAFEVVSKVDHVRFAAGVGGGLLCYTFLKNTTDRQINQVKAWLGAIRTRVAIRDCLHVSFALDYDREGGDPSRDSSFCLTSEY